MTKVLVKETASRLILTGTPEDLRSLSEAYKIRPPNYWRSPKFELFKQTQGKYGWDGYIYPLKITARTTAIFGRGHLEDLKEKALELDIELDLRGVLERPYGDITIDDIPDDIVFSENPPYPHQIDGVLKWMKHAIGINEITVSGGKTRTFCMAAAVVRRRIPKARVLYLVPTERLVSQATKDAKGFLPEWEIGQYGGKKRERDAKDMVVATYAIIGKNFQELSERWLKTFTVLMVDECHHASSPQLEQIIHFCPCFFKFGATDSAKEDDPIRGFTIRGLLGPVLTEMTAGPMIAEGKLAKPSIYLVDVPEWQNRFDMLKHQAEPETPAWAYINSEWKQGTYLGPAVERDNEGNPRTDSKGEEIQAVNLHRLRIGDSELDIESRWALLHRNYDRGIIRFKERNEMITKWATHFSAKKKRTLVACTRTLHVLILQNAIEKAVGEDLTRILFSAHSSKERDDTFDWYRETPGAVLITPLVKEGVSINEINAGIVADYISTVDVANQLIGRFIRKKLHGEENSAEIVWFVDRQVPSYRRGSLNLFRDLERIRGYEFRHPVTFPGTEELALKYEINSVRDELF